MPAEQSSRIQQLEREEADLVLPGFDHTDAWRLGSLLAERAIDAAHPVAIDIRRPGLILFRAALPGSAPDQQEWIERKSAVTLRLEASTALLAERFAAAGFDPSSGWLPSTSYAVAGGSVPIRVAGVGVVAAVTVSGLSSDEDHDFAVAGIRDYRDTRHDSRERVAE